MAKLTLSDVNSIANQASAKAAINTNNAAIETALENTLSRDGTSPNAMAASLDLGDNRALNMADPIAEADGVNLRSVRPLVNQFAAEIAQTIVEGTLRVEQFVATAGQQDFTLVDSPGVSNNVDVYDNGVHMDPDLDYSITGSDMKTLHFFTGRTLNSRILARYLRLSPADSLLRADLSQPIDTRGSALVSWQQIGTGMVNRTVRDKLRDIVHADDRNLLGDASNEAAALQNLLDAAAGKTLLLGHNKTYGFAGGVTIPDNTNLITNGSKFKKLSGGTTYGVTVGANVKIDVLSLDIPGSTDDAGIQVTGDDVVIGEVKVTSLASGAGFGAAVNALYVHHASQTVRRLQIGSITVSQHTRPVRFHNVDGLSVGRTTFNDYVIGCYVIDTKNGMFNGADISNGSTLGVGGAGENGLLLESSSAYATENLTFRGWHVADAPEHSFRIGGNFPVRNIWYYGCSSTNSGKLAGSTGGAAFKVLHSNLNASYHENVNVIGFDAVDCSMSAAALNNLAAFQIGKLKGGQFTDVNLRKRNNAYSAKYGFQVFASEDININNPSLTDVQFSAFQFIQAGIVSPAYPVNMARVHVNGGSAFTSDTNNASAVARWIVDDGTFTDVSIKGTTLVGGGGATRHDTPGAGSYVDCEVTCTYRNPLNVAGGPPFFNNNSVKLNVQSPFYGTFQSGGADGSLYQDYTNGVVKTRKAGVWVTV